MNPRAISQPASLHKALIHRSKKLHDAELIDAKDEVEKVKRAAKKLIKAVHQKSKDRARRSEAQLESERRQRADSQRLVKDLINSHSEQIHLLERSLRRRGSSSRGAPADLDSLRGEKFLQDESDDGTTSLTTSSGVSSLLDDLADEAYRQR